MGQIENPAYKDGTILDKASSYKAETAQTNSDNRQDFLKILMAQLKYQDPMDPMKDKDFMAQMAQFSTVEQLLNLNKSFDSFASTQKASANSSEYTQGIALLGKNVEVLKDGQPLKVTVSAVHIQDDGTVKVTAGADDYLLSSIKAVYN